MVVVRGCRSYQRFSVITEGVGLRNIEMKCLCENFCFNKRFYSRSNNEKFSNYGLYSQVKEILVNNSLNSETQMKIEKLLIENNVSRKSLKDTDSIYNVISMLNKDLKEELIKSCDDLERIIINFKNRRLHESKGEKLNRKLVNYYYLSEILDVVSVEYVKAILIGKTLLILNRSNQDEINSTKIFMDLGRDLVNEYFRNLYLVSKDGKYKAYHELYKDSRNFNYSMWDWREENKDLIEKFDSVVLHGIGALLIEWLRDVDLVDISLEKSLENYNQKISVILPTDKIKNLFSLKKFLVLPSKIPMIVEPKKYERLISEDGKSREILGGYLLNGEYYANEIIIDNWRSKEKSRIHDVNIIYNAINDISSVAYKINKDVLNFIRLNDDKLELTLVNKKHPLESENRKLLKWEKVELERFKSKRFVEENVIGLADTFENVPEFYIPVRMDYRGRIYCESDYLNYQGTELAKSLLLFARGEKILKCDENSINYLKIFGANCYGNKIDKLSFSERIKWVDDNLDDIRNFHNGKLISEAESKFMFIAFLFEFNRWLNSLNDSDNPYFITYLPIQLDASCNGYQHITMMVKDFDLAEKLNLTRSSKNEPPKDFYSQVGSFLNEYFTNKIKSKDLSDRERESYERLANLHITRNIIKKAVMTIPYNATSIQVIKYLKDSFTVDDEETLLRNETLTNRDDLETHVLENDIFNEENIIAIAKKDQDFPKEKQIWYKYNKDNNLKLESLDFVNIYRGIDYIITNVFPSLSRLSNYFKEIANICSILGINIPWYLPTGLEAHQSYMKIKETRVKPLNYSKMTFALKIPIRNEYDKLKQARALMPNLIHSLDSSSLILLLNKYFYDYKQEWKNIYAIHDCFAVTANNMEYIINTLKTVYISLYADEGYLIKLNRGFIEHIKNHVGDSFSEENLEIYLDERKKPLKFPDINNVIRNNYNIELIKDSAYILT